MFVSKPHDSSAAFPPLTPGSDRFLKGLTGIFATAPWLILALLIAVLIAQPAQAASIQDLTCGAKDLMAELKKSKPKDYEQILAQEKAIKNAGVRFWKLEKAGQKPNWLLGTIHLSDPRVTDLPEEARKAYDASSTVVLESDEILDPQKASMKLMAKPDLMMYSGTTSLKDFLTEDEAKVVEAGLRARGIPFGSVVKMKPYILSSMLAMSTCELSRKAGGAPFLDMKLAQDGVKSGKQVLGVETLAEQIEAMASLPNEFHVRSLVSVIRYPDYTRDIMETTINLYLHGNGALIGPVSMYFSPEKTPADTKDMAMFEEKLITVRNHTMADRGAPLLAHGNVFMAVGALHLVGDQGLVELFRKQGYTVTAVKN